MDVSKIISESRIQTNTSIGQKSDADMLDYLNIVYGDIFSVLGTRDKKYAWTSYTPTTTVIDQNEYTLPKETISDPGLKRLLKVEVMYDTEWRKAKIYDTSPIYNEREYNDYDSPFAIQRDGSLFLFPAPKQAISGGLRIEGQYMPLPLELSTTSESIKLAREYHELLIIGLNRRCFAFKQLFDKKQIMDVEFERILQRLINEGGKDIDGPYEIDNSYIIIESNKLLP